MATSAALEVGSRASLGRTLGRAGTREAIILGLAALPRLAIAYTDHGMLWGDEIFQSLEPAHNLAFGYGIKVWEFHDGARSWVFPGIIAAVMRLGAFLGAGTGLSVVGVVKTFMVAVGLVGVLAAVRLARRLGGETAALIAGVLCATFPSALVFGSRAMSETASGSMLVLAALLALSGPQGPWAAGALASLSIYLRYQNGLVAVGLLLLLVAQRRFAYAAKYATTATIVGILGGGLDYLTWGRWFHSFRVYWDFNFVGGNASRWGTSPFRFYFDVAWSSTGPLILLVALGLLLAARRAPGLLLVAALFVLAHCKVPHKEFRFMMPIVPLVLALAGVGLGIVLDRLDRSRAAGWALASVLAIGLLVRTRGMTLLQMGQFAEYPEWYPLPPWNFFGGVNRALAEAGMRDDLCGLMIFGVAPWWMGGFSYLHRNVPLFVSESPVPTPFSNYLIVPRRMLPPAGYESTASYYDYVLLHRDGSCAPRPPGYRHPLE